MVIWIITLEPFFPSSVLKKLNVLCDLLQHQTLYSKGIFSLFFCINQVHLGINCIQ